MITIIYSTHKNTEYNNKFKQHLLQTVGLKDVQILEYQNNNQYSLAQVYNSGITESNYDIVVCCHNDIKLEKNWGKKLIDDFSKNPEFGIIGKAGSCYFPESGVYWEKMNKTMVGQVYHHPEGQNKWLSRYSEKLPFLIPVVTIDGLFISFDKTKIKYNFDESFGRFHFYDHGFCLPNYINDVKIGVASSFEITHQSVGQPNQEFYESKEKFLKKYGHILPMDLKPSEVFYEKIQEKPLKGVGKVAVVIPTKGKIEMLFDCVNSFYQHCNSNLFEILIADTGSSDEEKEWIKNNILKLGNVKLIEYDYYNFAKINNDVVKNHTDETHEFILFCNNDIKILNNVIYGLLESFKRFPQAGTIGCRLHYDDNTVQHDGIVAKVDSNKMFRVDNKSTGSYYNYTTNSKEVLGNSAALFMIRKNVFIKLGMFNEKYSNCFEDVEINLKSIVMGHRNYICGNCVAHHYESKTRERNTDVEKQDYYNNLIPFVQKYLDKFITKLYI
jgi:GT2 family glycosyltransferase